MTDLSQPVSASLGHGSAVTAIDIRDESPRELDHEPAV